MTSAVFDFKAIAQANKPKSTFQITDGPATTLVPPGSNPRRVVPFSALNEPTYPAIMYYDACSDEGKWVECDDPFAIQVAEIKNAAALRLVEHMPVLAPLPVDVWADMLHSKLCDCGISCVRPPDEYDLRMGAIVRIGGQAYPLQQMHVDWAHELPCSEWGGPLEALAQAIDRKMAPSKKLYSYQLFLPTKGCEARKAESGNLRVRAIRTIVVTCDENGCVRELPVTRVDVLFCGAQT